MLAANRRDVHDRAGLLLAYKAGGKSPGHQECPRKTNVERLSPRVLGQFDQRARVHRDRAVYEQINAAEGGLSEIKRDLAVRAATYIEFDEFGVCGAQSRGQLLAKVTVHVANDDVSTLRDDVLGDLFANAARSSRDHRGLAGKPIHRALSIIKLAVNLQRGRAVRPAWSSPLMKPRQVSQEPAGPTPLSLTASHTPVRAS